MIFGLLIALALGILAGTFTGIAPGIHINLIALLVFANSALLLGYVSPIILAVFIVAMATTHVFLDFIPSIFLGAPEESTALAVLPGHSLLLEGRGYEAVRLTAIGGYIGLLSMLILTPLFALFLPPIYSYLEKAVPFMLVFASIFLVFTEPKEKRLRAMWIFLFSGALGAFTLNFHAIREPLFPLLTGLFGTSLLIASMMQKTFIPEQNLDYSLIKKKDVLSAIRSGLISAPLCSFLPGLGASQAAVLGSSFSEMKSKTFLILLGIIGTLVTGLNFVALYAIGKPRSGSAVIVGKMIELNASSLAALIATILVAGSISFILTLHISKFFAKNVSRFDYGKMSLGVVILLLFLSFILSGPYSLLVLITATALGIVASEWGVKKMHLMGCIIIPVIIYLLL